MTLQMPPLDDYRKLMPVISSWERGQAEFLGALLLRLLAPKSVIDLGCGSGIYLPPLARAGCRVMGIDADANAGGELTSEQFFHHDLRKPLYYFSGIDSIGQYDLALCIEVGEHLQPEFADTLVDNCIRAAPVIFWSASHRGQGGLHHYNEQPKSYWLEKFLARGYNLHPLDAEAQAAIATNDEAIKVQWLLNNSMLLHKP